MTIIIKVRFARQGYAAGCGCGVLLRLFYCSFLGDDLLITLFEVIDLLCVFGRWGRRGGEPCEREVCRGAAWSVGSLFVNLSERSRRLSCADQTRTC